MDLYEELTGLLDLLAEKKIAYALCGGIAVAFHGYPRFTKDIDIMIQPGDIDRVIQAVAERGFVFLAGLLPFDTGGPNERQVYRVSKIEGEEVLALDLVLMAPVFENVWESREYFDWNGKQIQVVSASGLAKMKRIAGRDQDILDLKKLGLFSDDDSPPQKKKN